MINKSQAVDTFVERLIEEKKFEGINSEVMNQIKIDLSDRVEDRINATILEHMPPEKLDEFNSILDNGNSEEIQTFCQNNIENLDEIIAETLVNFRSIYLNS